MSYLFCHSPALLRGGLLVIGLTLVPNVSAAQPGGSELRQTDVVRVDTAAGSRVQGRFVSATSDGITLSVSGRPVQVPTASILRVERRKEDPVWNGILIGLGIGAAIGTSVLVASLDSNAIYGAMVLAPVSAMGGAVVGWLADRGHHRWIVVGSTRLSAIPFLAPKGIGISAAIRW